MFWKEMQIEARRMVITGQRFSAPGGALHRVGAGGEAEERGGRERDGSTGLENSGCERGRGAAGGDPQA